MAAGSPTSAGSSESHDALLTRRFVPHVPVRPERAR